MKKFFIGSLVAVFSFNLSIGQENIKKLVSDFQSTDWEVVKEAKEKLENTGKVIIPEIIVLIKSDENKKLENTKDLIYPGATKFYGHGQMLEYQIDSIPIRAGWLLEDLTFQNFGFKGYHLTDKNELITIIKYTFPEYYSNSTNRKDIENGSVKEIRKTLMKLSLLKVNKWWDKEKDSWNRLSALLAALQSYDEIRNIKALFYIRNGRTLCPGLTKDYYIEEISREIVRLSGSEIKRISENAKLILLDVKYEWLEIKPQPE